MTEVFTYRECKIYQRGLIDARDIAQRTKKTSIAQKIQTNITHNEMLIERMFKNPVSVLLRDESSRNAKLSAAQYLGITALIFAASFCLAWTGMNAMAKQEQINQEDGWKSFAEMPRDYLHPESVQ